jgi:hypothetical protein
LKLGSAFGEPLRAVDNRFMGKKSHTTDKSQVRTTAPERSDAHQNAPYTLSRRARVLISAVLLYHVLAVFVGAWNAVPNDSYFAQAVNRPFDHYIKLADLNHGYRFFAPDPGPSHLFRYTLTMEDGTTKSGHFPNREEHWPRLLYHRYFMLTEQANGRLPGGPPPDGQTAIPPEAYSQFDSLANSYAAHLLKTNDARRIHWRLVRHLIPLAEQVSEGRSLTDERLYETLRSGVLLRDEAAEEVP